MVGLPMVDVVISGKKVRGLLDTGCSNTIVKANLVKDWDGASYVKTFDGRTTKCVGYAWVDVNLSGFKVRVKVIGAENLLPGVEAVIGMDVIREVGPVIVKGNNVEIQGLHHVATIASARERPIDNIEDKDFSARFDGFVWTVEWKWKNGCTPELKNMAENYTDGLPSETLKAYEAEVNRWIDEGILLPWEGECEGVLPLMAVVQPTKKKVRPVLDFRELNQYVECHTGDDEINICGDKLREWRQTQGELEIVDLKAAYLQIRVEKHLWKHQIVRFKGKTYCLTRLGFGLSVAPRVMTVVLKRVLGQDAVIKSATSAYIDDILVNTSIVKAGDVIDHLTRFGLESKPPELLDGGTALGLKLNRRKDGTLGFTRGNDVPEIPEFVTKRMLFSICGKMVGHYPIAGWLRVACSYMKRVSEGSSWDDDVGQVARDKLVEVRNRIRSDDPVKGAWTVPHQDSGIVWCDASNIAMGAMLEIGGVMVEDRAWLRKANDFNHINVAELDSVSRGFNMAVDWGLKELQIKTDSATVRSWVQLTLSEERPIKTKGAAEVLVKRRLGTLKTLIDELGMKVSVELVVSHENRADVLTRVPKV